MNKSELCNIIKSKALELGFLECGFAKAGKLEKEASLLKKWLEQGKHGSMSYMENYFEKRTDPTLLVQGAKSVISLLFNYYPEKKIPESAPYKISKYAYGRDYHKVLKKKLKILFEYINEISGGINGRYFVDSAPVMDKVWAQKSGLGWIGKHTNLINKKHGSYFFISEIISDLELEYENNSPADHCGRCTLCIDACPTNALSPYQIDGSKCISYFTIELKDDIPKGNEKNFNKWVFGCDICQDVCPWNRFSKPHNEAGFNLNPNFEMMQASDWDSLTEAEYNEKFKGSPLKRAGFEGIKKNIKYIT